MSAIDSLVGMAGEALLRPVGDASFLAALGTGLRSELLRLLTVRNGFYACDGALLVRPIGTLDAPLDLERWNLLMRELELLKPGTLCFAEDVFGGQFALASEGVVYLAPETLEAEPVAKDLEGWAHAILTDCDFLTGRPILSAWVRAHGALEQGCRLAARSPFVLGGAYESSNLRVDTETELIRWYGLLARQLANVPDGDFVSLVRK